MREIFKIKTYTRYFSVWLHCNHAIKIVMLCNVHHSLWKTKTGSIRWHGIQLNVFIDFSLKT